MVAVVVGVVVGVAVVAVVAVGVAVVVAVVVGVGAVMKLSNYAIRKNLRVELHAARSADHDHSPARMKRDGDWLNSALKGLGITDQREARWGR